MQQVNLCFIPAHSKIGCIFCLIRILCILMLIIFRQFLLAFLVLMQLFAPLVHAHTHKSSLTVGVHLPELEIFATPQERAYLHSAETALDADTLCVSMNTGMQHKPLNVPLDYDSGNDLFFLVAQEQIRLHTVTVAMVAQTFPANSQRVDFFVIPSLAPRAPPSNI